MPLLQDLHFDVDAFDRNSEKVRCRGHAEGLPSLS